MAELKIPENMIYIALDGDGIGRLCGRAVIANDADQLHKVSARIDAAQSFILHWANQHKGIKISGGGDEGVIAIPREALDSVESLRKDIEHAFGYTVSVGVGKDLAEAGTALLVAKLRGKDRIVKYSKDIKYDIKKAKRRVREKRASVDEYKLSEAYLKKAEVMKNKIANQPKSKGTWQDIIRPSQIDENKERSEHDSGQSEKDAQHMKEMFGKSETEENCPWCQQTDGVDPTHCKLCHEMEQPNGEECPLCAQTNQGVQDDCPLCMEHDTVQDGCALCAEQQASLESAPSLKPAPADDDFNLDNPQSMPSPGQPEMMSGDNHAANQLEEKEDTDHLREQAPRINSPDSMNSQAPHGSAEEKAQYDEMGMNPPITGKPTPGNDNSPAGLGEGVNSDAYGTTETPVAPGHAEGQEAESGQVIIPSEDTHSKEALQAIAEQIEHETADGKPDPNQIDDADIVDNGTEGNVTRPEGYDSNIPGDMGMDSEHPDDSEDHPDLSMVLKESLDSQSQDIDKEKVRDMVGQALEGFKASKQIVEKAKEQAPDFYKANIAMLAAMIKMSEMLGLHENPEGEAPEEEAQETLEGEPIEEVPNGTESQENEWNDPFPLHPDHGGVAKPGHSPSSEEGGTIGQPIGKLPAKATAHVARETIPEGGVNAKGQQKVTDSQGTIRFINRKQGMVQGPMGVPVKPPKRT